MSQAAPQQKPSIGRIVHYVLGEEAGASKGEIRPAIVVAMRHPELPNLQVFLDGPNDDAAAHCPGSTLSGSTTWRGSVPCGGPEQPGTWFWPPRV